MITSGSGRYRVWLKEESIGDDKVYLLSGGDSAHIGGAVIARPNEEPQIIRLGKHYDYLVLEPIAKEACKKYNTTVIALGGVHIDNATKDEIDIIVKNCRELLTCI
jgi:hypothetical protein